MSERDKRRQQYWATNVRYVLGLLSIWFVVSYGCGILFVDQLDQIRLGGFKLGFWFAQQGSIYTFVLLIIAYVVMMNRLDSQFEAAERAAGLAEGETSEQASEASERAGERESAASESAASESTDDDERAGGEGSA